MPGIWESDAEWRRLKRELDEWRARRVRADTLGQHRSQLEAAYTLVDRALAELRVAMATLPGADASIDGQWRVHDRRIAWLRRLWAFFRERFDQRDDPALEAVLRGADEVVWSCHREPFAALASSAGVEGGPPPLPYVEPALTPEVFPHGLVPGALRRDIDAPFLRHAIPATRDGEPLSNDLITCLPAVRELGSRAAAGDVTGVAAMQGVHLARELMVMESLR
jgi:hypothetical protein